MASTQGKQLTVLIAEDSDEFRTVLKAYLQSSGYDVTLAATGREAIRLLETHYFDLLVTDVIMPDADGLEVILETKRRYPTTRIIVITGGGQALDRDYCRKVAVKMGANAAVLKPFTLAEFAEAVAAAVPPSYTSPPFSSR